MKKILFTLMVIPYIVYGGSFKLSFENDLFADTDRHYTHGTMLAIKTGNTNTIDVPLLGDMTYNEFSLFQYMYTPSDITIVENQDDDRPWGGWTSLGWTLESIEDSWCTRLDVLIGIVGPHSYAEQSQKIVHKITDSSTPMGWDNQLDDEFALNLVYFKKYKMVDKSWFDLIPRAGACVGNVYTFADIGFTTRFGYNIPDDFGPGRNEPVFRVNRYPSIYALITADGRAVARNIFLDGNTFSDSHSVDKEILVGDIGIGLGIDWLGSSVSYIYNVRSKEFKGQEEYNEYATVTVTIRY